MSETTNASGTVFGRKKRLRLIIIAVVSLILAAGGFRLLPRRITQIVLVDRSQQWQKNEAPPRRQIIWQPAEEMVVQIAEPNATDSFIRPQLNKDGTTLYFTLRNNQGESDIYQARRIDGSWQEAEPIDALNSEEDDIGPILSADEKRLYLYSDRLGGEGGFDIYSSQLTADGWSKPINLGPTVNSLAHEYDPAESPDGKTLYYASNRTKKIHRLAAEASDQERRQWTATLRAEQGLLQFDLYSAQRERLKDPWLPSQPLAALNREESNEGAPYVSPSGIFFYFASNRRVRSGEEPNYDLFRARIDGDQLVDVENLGTGVNTPNNETEPSLSAEGFRLLFSSDRHADQGATDEDLYALYSSRAREVFEQTGWQQAQVPNLLQYWWWLLLALLVAALLAALVWYFRRVTLRRAPVPGFLLVALLVHFLLASGLFFVGIGDEMRQKIKQEFLEVVAMDYAEDDEEQLEKTEPKVHEKVAELKSIEKVELTDVNRKEAEVPEVTVVNEKTAPPLPNRLVRDLPPQQEIVKPQPEPESQANPELKRSRNTPEDQVVEIEPVEFEQAEETAKSQNKVQPTAVQVNRTAPTQTNSLPKLLQRRTIAEKTMQLESEEIEAVKPLEQPSPSTSNQPLQLARNTPVKSQSVESPIVETIGQAPDSPDAPNANTLPTSQTNVGVERRKFAEVFAPTGSLPNVNMKSAKVQLETADSIPSTRPEQLAAIPTRGLSNNPLGNRSERAMPTIESENATIEKEQGSSTPASTNSFSNASVAVNIARSGLASPEAPSPLNKVSTLNRPVGLPRGETTDRQTLPSALLSPANSQQAKLSLTRNLSTLANENDSDIEAIPTQAVQAAGSKFAEAASGQVDIKLPRRGATAPNLRDALAKVTGAKSIIGSPQADTSTDRQASSDSGTNPKSTDIAANLRRESSSSPGIEEAIETEVLGESPSTDTANPDRIAGIAVGLNRPGAQLLQPTMNNTSESGGLLRSAEHRALVGNLSNREAVDSPAFRSDANQLARISTRAPQTLYARDDIGLQAMFRLRRGDNKKDFLKAFGGNDETLRAVKRGLTWIERHQAEDGHWSLNQFNQQCKEHPKCAGHGSINSDTAGTGLALLPFLGDGHTHQEGDYQQAVGRGLKFLIEHQKEDGELTRGNEGNARMYSHGIGTIALCEALGMSNDPKLREPAQKAINFIVASQHKPSGGWRYQPNQPGDTSVVGWQVMALKSGQMAELNVPQGTLALVTKWLDSVEMQGDQKGKYGYTSRGATPTMTAEALLCREYLGASSNDPSLHSGAQFLLKNLPKEGQETSYYWYYGTQMMYHLQGDYWKQWNASIRDMLVRTQVKDGHMAGTWNPKDNWENSGGRIYTTSLRLLMLEVYYRHLPLYQVLQE
ncbi:MAG: hypothetical protein ACKVJN_00510 [Woeseiales bacterium]